MGQNLELHVVFIWMGQAVGFGVINPFEPCVFRNRVILSTRLTCSVTLCTPLVSLIVLCVCVSHTPLFAKKKLEWSAAEGRRDVVEDGCGVVGRIRCGR